MNDELLGCPHCGSQLYWTIQVPSQTLLGVNDYQVKCRWCFAKGPKATTSKEAERLWNHRHSGWLPIETHPQQVGKPVLLWWDGVEVRARWYNDTKDGRWFNDCDDYPYTIDGATHWRPCLEAPEPC